MFDSFGSFTELMNSILGVFLSIRLNNIVDIAILSYILYHAFKLIRETRALQLVQGILLLIAFYLLAMLFKLDALKYLLKVFFQWGIIALVILFQPELRRMIEKLGRAKITDFSFIPTSDSSDSNEKWTNAIGAICEAAQNLSATCTGALIICERKTRLGEQIDTGTILDCTPSAAVFGNIFYPNTPLHDGAVIMRDGKILAAGCFLPKPQKEELIAKQLGSRHRAAIGMSENSDAVVIVVSEETGTISVAENGELTRGFSKDSLAKLLRSRLVTEEQNDGTSSTFVGRMISGWRKK
ncbi:diadenylate cyclase [Ruminococcus sp. YE71]|uniref:diadenylate cyclase CdaA n=1 Tax=unclassified Ruminococcus TaxID=2608920 RepID=UPI00089275BA|nr:MULTISPECIES: diadenylate cyclase CdaA [unclassified Ruminococcus]SDA14259.1 diadenylate cyclase [Ruminococcus sp. YE78]SFW20773.1 diadenylate cyclase [Ruminococcus sp. YE71]